MNDTLAALVLVLIAWSWVCALAGQIWETRRRLTEDMNARDAWANEIIKQGRHHEPQ